MFDEQFFISRTTQFSGDSGSGFLFNDGEKWNLRGILSASLKDNAGQCDRKNYAIFIDVLRYIDWIPRGSNTILYNRIGEIKEGDPLLEKTTCGGLNSSPDDFLGNKKWLVWVNTEKGFYWNGFVITPKHVLTNILPKYSKEASELTITKPDCTECVLSNVQIIRRLGEKWFHPTVLTLSDPLVDVTSICIDRVKPGLSEDVLIASGTTNFSDPKFLNSQAVLSRSENCLQSLYENSRLKEKYIGKYFADYNAMLFLIIIFNNTANGVDPSRIYCSITGEDIALQLHRNSKRPYWSLFGFWLIDNVYTSISDYATSISYATQGGQINKAGRI